MRTVNPIDWMRHHPVKLICGCVLKACIIMHLCMAAKLKLHCSSALAVVSEVAGREGCEGPHALDDQL